jgi:hypothetical protein
MNKLNKMKMDLLNKVSDHNRVYKNYIRYMLNLNKNLTEYPIYISDRKDKKYMIFDSVNDKNIHFGSIFYEDFTKHNDEDRRINYLKRSLKNKGDWKDNFLSPNNLSINLLWN